MQPEENFPHRLFTEKTLVCATHNKGKVPEIAAFLQGRVAEILTASDLNLPEVEETETTFAGNAILKARAAAMVSGKVSLADDSGLCVDALGGDPGVYSARWAGPERDFNFAMQRVHDAMGKAENTQARFVSVLALCWPDGHCETFEGVVEGNISWPPRGDKGFGYDAIFVPLGYDVTFAQMDPAFKQAMSHRAKAFEALVAACFP